MNRPGWLPEKLASFQRHFVQVAGCQVQEAEGSLALELADILFVVICIANSQHIDLDDAFADMMAKVTSRDADRWTKKAR